jgi:hypothetical protein
MEYIYHHLGLGDHIICNGLVRNLISKDEENYLFVKPQYIESVSFMYKDLHNLNLIPVKDDYAVVNYLKSNDIKDASITCYGGTPFGYYKHPLSKEFDDSFYLQNNLSFDKRWTDFKCSRYIKREMELFNKYGVKEGEYVFLHEDVSRGFKIDRNKIIRKDLPIIEPKSELTNNVFDYTYLMSMSYESHFIDSSFRLIFDSYKLRTTNIFYHINLLDGVIKDNTTKSQSNLNFTII